MRNRGYYLNGLRSWREELRREQRLAVSRLRRMEDMKHPDAGQRGQYGIAECLNGALTL